MGEPCTFPLYITRALLLVRFTHISPSMLSGMKSSDAVLIGAFQIEVVSPRSQKPRFCIQIDLHLGQASL